MGLDMYAYTVPANLIGDRQVGFSLDTLSLLPGFNRDYYYWRNFYPLHQWAHGIYEAKGGSEIFNCEPVRITLEDVEKLEQDLRAGEFNLDLMDKDAEGLFEFIDSVRQAEKDKLAVIYNSWW